MSTCAMPWFLGLTTDHLYEDCPNRQRGLRELQRVGWDKPGLGDIDPHDLDVCGMCLHRHNQKEHRP